MTLDWYYPRPELARSYLEEFSRRGARALTVFAERGLGKTAFLQRDLTGLAGEKTILLMLDEVQELAIHREGASVAAALRASMQRNYGRFQPVFTGSQRDKLLQMFAVSKAPLFEFGDDIDFPPLTRAFSAFVAECLNQEANVTLDVDQLHAAFVALGYKPGSFISLVRWMLRARTYDITAACLRLSPTNAPYSRETLWNNTPVIWASKK